MQVMSPPVKTNHYSADLAVQASNCLSGNTGTNKPLENAARAGGAFNPRTVTRGESIEGDTLSKTVIDYVRCTFNKPAFTVQFLIGLLEDYMQVNLQAKDSGKGLHGFKEAIRLEAFVNGAFKQIGFIAFGGETQKGRWMLDFTGQACGLIKDWDAFQDLLEGLEARLTRVDIALDFLEGQKTVDHAVKMYKKGEFTLCGRPPESSVAGDWVSKEKGRTLYIGNIKNGKELCIYEKGKQLGDLESEWTRYELRLGNKDREIPYDILTSPDKFYAGAYPVLEKLLKKVQGELIETISKETKINLVNLLFHVKRCYGKLFSTIKEVKGYDVSDLIESITISGLPNRLDPNSLDAMVTWEDLKTELKGRERM